MQNIYTIKDFAMFVSRKRKHQISISLSNNEEAGPSDHFRIYNRPNSRFLISFYPSDGPFNPARGYFKKEVDSFEEALHYVTFDIKTVVLRDAVTLEIVSEYHF